MAAVVTIVQWLRSNQLVIHPIKQHVKVSPSPLASTSAASFGVGVVLQEFATLRDRGGREDAMTVIMELRMQAMMLVGMVSMFTSGARFHEHKEQERKMREREMGMIMCGARMIIPRIVIIDSSVALNSGKPEAPRDQTAIAHK
ncbi:hypothetical protein NC651_029771 [Populus alba x Populus x berolinensis]|nr:hypothetical protein NC651_029771 [Populus alba x Populus x berolinensis]